MPAQHRGEPVFEGNVQISVGTRLYSEERIHRPSTIEPNRATKRLELLVEFESIVRSHFQHHTTILLQLLPRPPSCALSLSLSRPFPAREKIWDGARNTRPHPRSAAGVNSVPGRRPRPLAVIPPTDNDNKPLMCKALLSNAEERSLGT